MMSVRRLLECLRGDQAGAMAIETAIVAPVLVLLSLGAYQVSTLVARQGELQSAMGVAAGVALASTPDTEDKRLTLKNIIAASTGLAASQIVVSDAYRCNANDQLVIATSNCTVGDKISSYVKIDLTDTYVPFWREFGVGSDVTLNVNRFIMIEQKTKL